MEEEGRFPYETDQYRLWKHGFGQPTGGDCQSGIRAKDRGTLIDATYGRRTRAVLVTDSDHVILSAVQPETVANRLNDREEEDEEELEDDE